jgi:AhpD family alkylhydroperoxidase
MSRITAIDPAKATGNAKELFDAVKKKLGLVPNMMRTMPHSPSVLEGYLNFGNALAGGSLDAKIREEIAITVASTNQCGYCLSAHHAIGKMAGLTNSEMTGAQTAKASNAKTQAILTGGNDRAPGRQNRRCRS